MIIGKLVLVFKQPAMKNVWDGTERLYTFIALSLQVMNGQLHSPTALPPVSIGLEAVGPIDGLDVVAKEEIPAPPPRVVRPVTSH